MANELILIVEDNPKALKLVRDTLQGYPNHRDRDGEDGVRLAHERAGVADGAWCRRVLRRVVPA
jgi:hypothetical protein